MSSGNRRHLVWLEYVVLVPVLLVFAFWPLRTAFMLDQIPGVGPDVVSSVWGAWWAGQVGSLQALGSWTDLVNYPNGSWGNVLAPSGTFLWAELAGVLGWPRAGSVVLTLAVSTAALLLYWLLSLLGVGLVGRLIGSLGFLGSQHLLELVVLGSVVSLAFLPLLMGLVLLASISGPRPRTVYFVLLGLIMVWQGLEDPYLAPVIPAATVALCAHLLLRGPLTPVDRRVPMLLGALAFAVVGLVAVVLVLDATSNPGYPVRECHRLLDLGWLSPRSCEAVFSRVSLDRLVLARPPDLWGVGPSALRGLPAGRYLGGVLWVLAGTSVVTCPRRALPWLMLSGCGIMLALGSELGGLALPFAWLNGVAAAVLRPVTQPARFVILALVGLAVAAGIGVDCAVKRLPRRLGAVVGVAVLSLLMLDMARFGYLSHAAPSFPLADPVCIRDLPEDGAVIHWPADALQEWSAEPLLLQMRHGRAIALGGIGAWKREKASVEEDIRQYARGLEGSARSDIEHLLGLGYRYVIASPAQDQVDPRLSIPALGTPVRSCSGYRVYDLEIAKSIVASSTPPSP